MSGWNRLTNGQRDELVKLPVWTTEEDRRRALAYTDRSITGVGKAIAAVRAGRSAPANLGVIVAIARYESAGWRPDGNFDRWCRWMSVSQGTERLDAGPLIQWLGFVESDTQRQLGDLESSLSIHCQEQAERLAAAQADADRASRHLFEHHEKLILGRLSVGDTQGAREITRRMPAGSWMTYSPAGELPALMLDPEKIIRANIAPKTELLVLSGMGLRFGVPGHYGTFDATQTFDAALTAARAQLAAGHARAFVAIRIEAKAIDSLGTGTERELVRFEVYPDRVVLVPDDQGGLSDEQREKALALSGKGLV
jgi:hypothetical protein